jgi:hypothetical protein
MEQMMSGTLGGSLSTVPQGQIIDFEKAELRRMPFQDSLYLWVKGRLPAEGFDARLAPRIYKNGRPDYWAIDVAVFSSLVAANDALDAQSLPGGSLIFERSVPLTGITGIKGVTVIGANHTQRIEIDSEVL